MKTTIKNISPPCRLDDLDTTAGVKTEIKRSISNYRRMGIDIDIISVDNIKQVATIKIAQNRLLNGYILNNKQLHSRGREVFENLTNYKVNIIPVVFSLQVSDINLEWIKNKMNEFGINRKDLIKQLALDKSSLSLTLSGKRELTKFAKAAFYYYFLTYELNRDFREIN